jgi:hypothetical protein
MALDNDGIRFMMYARKLGVSFARTATVGRQILFPEPGAFHRELQKNGFGVTRENSDAMLTSSDGYAEDFFRLIGAESVESFDASSYENATRIHDFNEPLPAEYKNKYSVVIDGGTLEHVFNFPTAIKNCMEMLEVGGHFLNLTPANNFMGHGFYQFSPELFFRIFSPENGFQIEKMLIHEWLQEAQWYEITDPEEVRERVTLMNYYPSLILVIAKKIADVPVLQTRPQQSDYSAMWDGKAQSEKGPAVYFSPDTIPPMTVSRLVKTPVRAMLALRRKLKFQLGVLNRNPKHFKKTDV